VKPPLKQGRVDDFQTPPQALAPLMPFLRRNWTIWECAEGRGNLSTHLRAAGHKVVGSDILDGRDFLTWEPPYFDCIITNPPYSLKTRFLERAYSLGTRFAFLVPLTTFEGRERQAMFKKHGIEVILFDKRINFEKHGHESGSWFMTAWFTHGGNARIVVES
jgi:hypothetical protein